MSNGLYNGKFFEHFDGFHDPRQEGKVLHPLTDILFIVTAAVICKCDEWDDICLWASVKMNQDWLEKYISLPNGVPSLSTIKRAMGIIQPEVFSTRFMDWMKDAITLPDKDVVAVDGKTSRGSKGRSKDDKALHIVSALCHSHGLVIGQTKTDEKSNEITAIPELLDQLFIEGSIVTIDAMGAQKKIVKKIVKEKKADYVINLKGNQGTLQNEVKDYFVDLEQNGELNTIKNETQQGINEKVTSHRTLDQGHGRIEKRTYTYSTDLEWMVDAKRDWEKLTGIGKVVREVEYIANPTKKTTETAYYICSVDNVNDFALASRNHWGVESMHWSLDVTFGDDRNQTRESVAAQNLANVKRLAFNTVKSEVKVQPKMSKPNKRLLASMDTEYRDILMDLNLRER